MSDREPNYAHNSSEDYAETPDPIPVGYIVLLREHGEWHDNWDGDVHADIRDGQEALADALRASFDAILCALVPQCDCYPFGVSPSTYEGPQEHCVIHGRGGVA